MKDGIDPKNLKIAYIGGGSKGWAWGLMSDLASEPHMAGTVRLYDIDHQSALSNEIIGNLYNSHPDSVGQWHYKASESIAEALSDADFVIISILPGDFSAMASDVHTPESWQIYQSVGDTTGPGGLVRALRTVPMLESIGRAIRANAPTAWVINYTNPMAVCMRTLYRIFPEIKAFGCCHEVFGTQELLADLLETEEGLAGLPREEIHVNVLGINHFTWLDNASWKNHDLFPMYSRVVEKYMESGFAKPGRDHWMNSYFTSANRVKMDLFRQHGIIAAAGDRHLAEFVPDPYLLNPESAKKWMFSLTPVSWRISRKAELDERSGRLVKGLEKVEINPTGEEGVRQIKALLGLGDIVTNVNLPNIGQQSLLPGGAVVETNACFSRDHVRPLSAGVLPPAVAALVARHVYIQENTVTAASNRDLKLALQAFQCDPLIRIPSAESVKLFQKMINNTRNWLEEYF